MRAVDISVVTYEPDAAMLQRLLASLAEARDVSRHLFIEDNSRDASLVEQIRRSAPEATVNRSGTNVGFGRAHNANAARGRSPFLLVVNQDCVLEPGALTEVLARAEASAADIAAWEFRQVPYEHPKAYDPVTLETAWVSGACTLFRRAAFEAVGGFDAAIFLYGEDVDLSWRLRAAGWRLLYQPRCAVVHETYHAPHEVKPLALYEGVTTHLCLRARYAGPIRTLRGLGKLAREILAPQPFAGRRLGLMRAGLRFLARWPRFAYSRVRATPTFQPRFLAWDYERHRDGAFHPFRSRREAPPDEPLVSILIRTCGRPAWLRQALISCANQTYRNLEVVVVEGGGERCRKLVDEFAQRLRIRYHASAEATSRARNGNIALTLARGEWLNFLDDDDVLFADHVEVVLGAALRAGVCGAYGLAWETPIRIRDRERADFAELPPKTRHAQRFDRMVLWHHNYLPIQSVVFHRRLYERHGGFDESLDQLEDWNLWTRYTLDDDFLLVEKTTSKYRVPADAHEAAHRQASLDRAYVHALDRQRAMRATFSPQQVLAMAEAHARRHRLLVRMAGRMPGAQHVLRLVEGITR